ESVVAGHAGVTACPAHEHAHDMVTTSDCLAPQLTVNHVAALVGPDAAALHAGATVGEADRLRLEPDRRTLRSSEQHRPCQFEDGRAVIGTQAQRPARTCRSPRALERAPFTSGGSRRGGTVRLAARGYEQGKGERQPSQAIHKAPNLLPARPHLILRNACSRSMCPARIKTSVAAIVRSGAGSD